MAKIKPMINPLMMPAMPTASYSSGVMTERRARARPLLMMAKAEEAEVRKLGPSVVKLATKVMEAKTKAKAKAK